MMISPSLTSFLLLPPNQRRLNSFAGSKKWKHTIRISFFQQSQMIYDTCRSARRPLNSFPAISAAKAMLPHLATLAVFSEHWVVSPFGSSSSYSLHGPSSLFSTTVCVGGLSRSSPCKDFLNSYPTFPLAALPTSPAALEAVFEHRRTQRGEVPLPNSKSRSSDQLRESTLVTP